MAACMRGCGDHPQQPLTALCIMSGTGTRSSRGWITNVSPRIVTSLRRTDGADYSECSGRKAGT